MRKKKQTKPQYKKKKRKGNVIKKPSLNWGDDKERKHKKNQ